MAESLVYQIIRKIEQAAELYHQLLLVIAPMGGGKPRRSKRLENALALHMHLDGFQNRLTGSIISFAFKIHELNTSPV